MTAERRAYVEPELTAPVMLCTPEGRLNRAAVGCSRRPVHTCNLPASLPGKKRWNYWALNDERFFFSATIADIDYLSLAFVYVYELATQRFAEKTVIRQAGAVAMPETPTGDLVFEHPQMSVALLDDGAGTRIVVEAGDFHGAPLSAEVRVQRPEGHETLNVVIPWSDERFQFTSKQNTLPCTGSVRWGDDPFLLEAPAYACLDYGRGVWPEETRWNWGSASGVQDGRVVGLNLGGQWTDGTGMNENGVCVDGRLSKIHEDLVFEYERDALMRPWQIRTAASERVALRFEPEYERVSKAGAGAYMSEVHQLFGRYSGTVVSDGGEVVRIEGMFGWIEDHVARW